MNDLRNDLVTYIYDEYKGIHGIRPRWIDFDSMSIDDLKEMADDIEKEIKAEAEWEKIEEEIQKKLKIEADKEIALVCARFEIDRATYDRWMKDCDRLMGYVA